MTIYDYNITTVDYKENLPLTFVYEYKDEDENYIKWEMTTAMTQFTIVELSGTWEINDILEIEKYAKKHIYNQSAKLLREKLEWLEDV